jgi:hypothetical protein
MGRNVEIIDKEKKRASYRDREKQRESDRDREKQREIGSNQ